MAREGPRSVLNKQKMKYKKERQNSQSHATKETSPEKESQLIHYSSNEKRRGYYETSQMQTVVQRLDTIENQSESHSR